MSRLMSAALAAAALLAAAPLFSPGALAQAPAPAAPPPPPLITQVKDGLYKVQSVPGTVAGVTVFLVTSDAIILADPLNVPFSEWLKGELATRFPGNPVKFVLQTHYHWDHSRGGRVFPDAKVIAQADFDKNRTGPIRNAPPPGEGTDTNGDDKLDKTEAKTGTLGQFDRLDLNHDGFLTQAEMHADTRAADITFKDRYVLNEGGQQAILVHAGNRHTSDMYDVYFPKQKVLFANDYIWPHRMCCGSNFDGRTPAVWIASLKKLEALDFDTIVASHWDTGTKADVVRVRQYLEDLQAAIAAGIKQGKTADELASSIKLDKYKDFAGYDAQLPVMVKSAYVAMTRAAQK
jgi:glyoxylase-like metal-dependent hydrolase (beta-lactamase superfamily II)